MSNNTRYFIDCTWDFARLRASCAAA